MRKLTHKQRRFCDIYLKTGNARQSAMEAGYSKKSAGSIAAENLSKPYIKRYLEEKQDEISRDTIADAIEVQEYLTSVIRGEIDEEILIGTGKGNQSKTTKSPSVADRTKAAELLGKRYALFTDNVNNNIEGAVEIIDDLE